jgi:hypothetical protein
MGPNDIEAVPVNSSSSLLTSQRMVSSSIILNHRQLIAMAYLESALMKAFTNKIQECEGGSSPEKRNCIFLRFLYKDLAETLAG